MWLIDWKITSCSFKRNSQHKRYKLRRTARLRLTKIEQSNECCEGRYKSQPRGSGDRAPQCTRCNLYSGMTLAGAQFDRYCSMKVVRPLLVFSFFTPRSVGGTKIYWGWKRLILGSFELLAAVVRQRIKQSALDCSRLRWTLLEGWFLVRCSCTKRKVAKCSPRMEYTEDQ